VTLDVGSISSLYVNTRSVSVPDGQAMRLWHVRVLGHEAVCARISEPIYVVFDGCVGLRKD
jgi:hypothetical protein